MSDTSGALAADREFFKAVTDGNRDELNWLLADDFILIDVMRGEEVPKTAIVELVGSGQLKFESITPAAEHVRHYGSTAIVIGRTGMRVRFEETAVTVKSRYTHVCVEAQDHWMMVSAQGTQVSEGENLGARTPLIFDSKLLARGLAHSMRRPRRFPDDFYIGALAVGQPQQLVLNLGRDH
jgi:hypothetical protein